MEPPTSSSAEIVAALIKGTVSTIPIVGNVISEVGNLYLNPLEKRKQRWMLEVSRAITDIQDRFLRLPELLEQDDLFISVLYQATIIALKNHQNEKFDALRNALVSTADPERISEDLVFQFLRYTDELSVTHLNILAALEKNAEEVSQFTELEQVYAQVGYSTGLSLDRAMFRTFLHDLDDRFLILLGDIDDFPEYASKVSHLLLESSKKRPLEITSLGHTFISFIQAGVI
uniref:Uncharacterized protein n=1 Tax=Cyanothece sp. (strain PCC 7425 / ATCC 29141) TaxID=395961 RepID=B8HMH1_CYAP4